jgi:hypothetical protein
MSDDLDLTEALAAADKAWKSVYFEGAPNRVARDAAVAAAAPLIAAQVRARIAADLLAVDPMEWALAGMHAGEDAASIARGDS